MLTYFQYLERLTFKRKAIWIAGGVAWFYIAAILLIIPASLDIPPDLLWNNTIVSFQAQFLLLYAIVASIACSIIFRESRDDGTELVILAKPISRSKIILVKFIVFVITLSIIIFVGALLILCTLFFGRTSPSNQHGIDYSTLPALIGGYILASYITLFLFGGIAILISSIAGKVAIIISTVGLSIVARVLTDVIPLVSMSINKYTHDNYSLNWISRNALSIDGDVHYSTNIQQVIGGYDSKQAYEEAFDHITTPKLAYINVGEQLDELYSAFNESSKRVSRFGQAYDIQYNITTPYSIFYQNNGDPYTTNDDDSNYKNNKLLPQITMWKDSSHHDYLSFRTLGIFGSNDGIYSTLIGGTEDELYMVRVNKADSVLDYVDSTFYGNKEISYHRDNDKFNEYVDWLISPNHLPVSEAFVPTESGCGFTPAKFAERGEDGNVSSKAVMALRERVCDDLLVDEHKIPDALKENVYHGKCLGFDVYKDNPKYNQNLAVDFLQVMDEINRRFSIGWWGKIYEAIDNGELKPISEWNDNDSATNGILAWFDAQSESIVGDLVSQANFWTLNNSFPIFTDFVRKGLLKPFATTKGEKYNGQYYVDPNLTGSSIYTATASTQGSETFSSIYGFSQKRIIYVNNTIAFWLTFSIFMLCLSSVIYYRTDIK